MEAAKLAIQSGGIKHQDVLRTHHGYISGRENRSSPTLDDILAQRKSPGLGRGFTYQIIWPFNCDMI
jgi:hypothetical protein